MKKAAMSALLVVLMCSSSAVWAAGKMKPGLWEMTVKTDAMKNMPKLSAEQQEQMRKAGVNLPNMQDGGMTMKMCMTKEMTEREQTPGSGQSQLGCESKNAQQSGNSYSVDIVCNSATMKGEGKMKGVFNGSESYSSTYDFKGTVHGRPTTQHHESNGKWLSADCGSVKPITVPPVR